jgi:taurine dioxygenase
MTYQTLETTPLTPHIGAEVDGIDLSAALSPEQQQDVRQAFIDWKVLVFRNQDLNPDQHKDFGRLFGSLHVHPLQHDYGGDPEILTVKTTAKSRYTAGDGWHTDVSCEAQPPLGSMLYMKEVPDSGGDTLFANMHRAYEALSEPMQAFLGGQTAIHDGAIPYIGGYGIAPPAGQNYPRTEHPVITRHPESGERVLFVNSGFTSHIVGMHRSESRALLDMLFTHIASTPSLTCRVRWEPGTLTFWDNRCTQHHAVWDYHPQTRHGERVSIIGERPAA